MLTRGTWIAVATFFFVASACGSNRPADCPVTVPNGSTPPGEAPSDRFYGNGQLWTVLWPEGTVNIATEDMDDAIRDGLKWPGGAEKVPKAN